MPVTLASRAEIVKKMDQQFNDDLKMRQDTTTVGKELLEMLAQLKDLCHGHPKSTIGYMKGSTE